jgi:predicted alpha-1,6-mannanase (GH76 family)
MADIEFAPWAPVMARPLKAVANTIYNMIHHSLNILLSISSFSQTSPYTSHAEAALSPLNQWYNQTSGIWDTTGWWNSANCLTTISNLAITDPNVLPVASQIIPNTFVQAQKYNFHLTKRISPSGLVQSYERPSTAPEKLNGFLNAFYDDEGWWALAWIAAYDLTHDLQYLQAAESIFEDMAAGWTAACGGIWWDKNHTYIAAISNELFLSVAAHLANRSANKVHYLSWAQLEWAWFQNTGMINSQGNINDGVDIITCKNNIGTVWSYNQGVILSGLVELNRAAPNSSLLLVAQRIAAAAIVTLTDENNVLHDPCEPNCGADGSQFKGVFMRNLQILQQVSPNPLFSATIKANADSIWANDRDLSNELSVVWSGPFIMPANASTQSSALDALVAAAALL